MKLLKKSRAQLSLVKDFIYDYKRFVKYSATSGLKNKNNMQAYMIKEYHAIEKGLSLKNRRPGFAEARIIKLLDVLPTFIENHGKNWVTEGILTSLQEYLEFEKLNGNTGNKALPKIEQALKESEASAAIPIGGSKVVTKSDIIRTLDFDFEDFFRSRYSTREFLDKAVDTKTIEDALNIARYTPSVCNRQSWKAFLVDKSNPELLAKFLKVQNGNRGFTEHISSLIIVTSKLSSFFQRERNQAFVDGGMFAMSIIMSLHAKGLGTCCLNTSYTAYENEEFKKVMSLDEDCIPIMFIAVGYLPEDYKVAISHRKPVDEIFQKL